MPIEIDTGEGLDNAFAVSSETRLEATLIAIAQAQTAAQIDSLAAWLADRARIARDRETSLDWIRAAQRELFMRATEIAGTAGDASDGAPVARQVAKEMPNAI